MKNKKTAVLNNNHSEFQHVSAYKTFPPLHPLQICLIGCGGTGSRLLTGLANINEGLKALNKPGIDVLTIDGDAVSAANVGRQLFSRSEIGRNKAETLTSRLNAFYGTTWKIHPEYVTEKTLENIQADIIITAVDNVAARVMITKIRNVNFAYWLDTGNTMNTGQVILGTILKVRQPAGRNNLATLPHILNLYPEMDKEENKEYQGPSCSVAAALRKQDLFINAWISTAALEIMWHLLKGDILKHHGAIINAKNMTMRPIAVNPLVWEAMGYKTIIKKAA